MSDLWADDRKRLSDVVEALSDLSCTLLEYAADNGPLGDPDVRETCLMALTAGETARGAALLARRAVELLPKPPVDIEIGLIDTKAGKEEPSWNTEALKRDFDVKQFAAPFVLVVRKSDGVRGTLQFQNNPRLYFGFQPAEEQ